MKRNSNSFIKGSNLKRIYRRKGLYSLKNLSLIQFNNYNPNYRCNKRYMECNWSLEGNSQLNWTKNSNSIKCKGF